MQGTVLMDRHAGHGAHVTINNIRHSGPDPASSLNFWIPAFAGMTARSKPLGIILNSFPCALRPVPCASLRQLFMINILSDYFILEISCASQALT